MPNDSLIQINNSLLSMDKEQLITQNPELVAQAQQEELKMQIASALTKRKITINQNTYETISRIYGQFHSKIYGDLKSAVDSYIRNIKQAESISDDFAKNMLIEEANRQLKSHYDLIQTLANKLLQTIDDELNPSSF